jgi:hypothetical protein
MTEELLKEKTVIAETNNLIYAAAIFGTGRITNLGKQ